ncbi:uncharacterized protein BCR38DRAFT_28151 [Pseudomassariella vexata]|uniref:Uncharacterized protein n=1 Tax=Pseudomassariella vexata TaxID=1141098 RepID=A0A1Y2EMT7_9PEZI|nr:uncharacterized protein BCR38DRAFT_28151 [Pseudomassariella vexata]ORY72145.1 hypothetical protein BCR38DRAFT_28151 [Pseudomassariella vexata]
MRHHQDMSPDEGFVHGGNNYWNTLGPRTAAHHRDGSEIPVVPLIDPSPRTSEALDRNPSSLISPLPSRPSTPSPSRHQNTPHDSPSHAPPPPWNPVSASSLVSSPITRKKLHPNATIQTECKANYANSATPRSKYSFGIKKDGIPQHHTWRLEISAVLLSLCAVAVSVILLISAHDRPLAKFDWFISFNTVISILGAVSRASLGFAIGSCLGQGKWNWFKMRSDRLIAFEKFEEASRGPWGSMWLLLWLKLRHWTALGAVVTIVLLGFEPFLQAVIDFEGRIDSIEGVTPPIIGAGIRLDSGKYYTSPGSPISAIINPANNRTWSVYPHASQPDLGMAASVYSGFYNSSSTNDQTVSFLCPSGNCTWAPFASLAVCGKCYDVMADVKREELFGTDLGTITATATNFETNYTRFSLPYISLSNMAQQKDDQFSAWMAAATITNPGRSIKFKNNHLLLSVVGVIKADDTYRLNKTIWSKTSITATECALYFCTNAYNSSVQHGRLQETVIGTWTERVPGSFSAMPGGPLGPSNFSDFESYNNDSLYSYFGNTDRYDLQLQVPESEAQTLGLVPENATLRFNVSQDTIGSTIAFLNTNFFQTSVNPQAVWPQRGSQGFSQTPAAQAFYESTNLTKTFEKVAQSMTKWIRDYSNATQRGVQEEWVIHIQVQWWYLACPLATVMAGCLFMLLSMLETRRLGLKPWKTDVIATLAHALDAETRAQLRFAERRGHGVRTAERMVVGYEDSGCGLELKAKQPV